jgi:hypothetical protein
LRTKVPGRPQPVVVSRQQKSDTQDGDGVCDTADNCLGTSNASQADSDQDGYGNACDPDVNNDGVVGGPDFAFFRAAFGSQCGDPEYDPVADFNDDCVVGGPDFTVFAAHFGGGPGPSAHVCAGTVPCP